jgi:hypothetical protein
MARKKWIAWITKPPSSGTCLNFWIVPSSGGAAVPLDLQLSKVVGHSVAHGSNEIAIRMVLGARTMEVLRLMANSSMMGVGVAGVVVDVIGTAGLTRLQGSLIC